MKTTTTLVLLSLTVIPTISWSSWKVLTKQVKSPCKILCVLNAYEAIIKILTTSA